MSKIAIATPDNEVNENNMDYVTSNKGTEKSDLGTSDNNYNQLVMTIDIEYYNKKQKEQSKSRPVTTIQSSSLQTTDTLIAQNITSSKNNTRAKQYNANNIGKVHNNTPKPIFKWISKEEMIKLKRKKSISKEKTYKRVGKNVETSNVTLNTLTRCNTCMEWNTLQDGYDKQDKEITNKLPPKTNSRQDSNKNYEHNHSSKTVQTTKNKMPNSLLETKLILNDVNTKLGFELVSVTTENPGELFTYLCYVEHMTALGKGHTKKEAMESAANHLYEEYVQGKSIAKYISKLTCDK